MTKKRKISTLALIESLKFLPNRTPEMAVEGGAEEAFAEVSRYRDSAIYVGHYSGNSEWERHPSGDEIVMALEGKTRVILRVGTTDELVELQAGDIVVVPENTWHRFEHSQDLKVLTVTPQPKEHSVADPHM